ncbi:MAG: prolipoprotein diacylglyceryl transferase [Oscillospiraceae bacterium]|nr:prolipoprotein diacylglyceryl transferase [Oscillospiraceae bacterium]
MNPSDFSTISFPGIGFEWDPARNFSIGPLTIQFYGVIIAVGLLLAVLYACGRSKEFGLTTDDLTDGVLFIVPFAILCARLYYCAFEWDRFKDNPVSILYIWEGGLAIYGGVIGAAIGIVVFSLIKKVKLGAVLDITSLGFLIGQSIGRWGNFFNREAFGAETDSFFRMGLTNIKTGVTTYYHPTFLYESVWNLVGFILLHFLSKRRKYDGQVALGYLAWYGLGRTFIEGLRMDSLYWGNFRVSQMLAAISCFIAVAALMLLAFKEHDPQKMQVHISEARRAAAEEAELAETEEVTEESEAAAEEATEEVAEEVQEEEADG